MIVLTTLATVTVAAAGLWAAVITRHVARRRPLRRLALIVTLVGTDAWLWVLAFDSGVGPFPALRAVVIVANAVLALGVVQSLFGVRPKSDVSRAGGPGAGVRYGSMVGRDESLRLNGLD